jgi:hypothetical protein
VTPIQFSRPNNDLYDPNRLFNRGDPRRGGRRLAAPSSMFRDAAAQRRSILLNGKSLVAQ